MGLLLLLAAAVRVYGAWLGRFSTSNDCAVVYLMVKHMLEGRDVPVFYYGQTYMGNVEPLVSAVLCLAFGLSRFVVNLGTALVSFLALPLVYRWARDAGDRVSAVAALAFCIVGPDIFYCFQFAPRGGYGVALLIGTAVLWYGVRTINRELEEGRVRRSRAFLLGLLVGVGWWANQLAMAAVATTAVLFLIALRWRAFRWARLWPAATGFLLGSLPYWLCNFSHGWGSFALVGTFSGGKLLHGLNLLWADRLPELLDLNGASPWSVAIRALLYAGALLIALVALFQSLRRNGLRGDALHILSAVLLILVVAVLVSASSFVEMHTPRYLIPMVPALAVVVGLGTSFLVKRWPFGLGWAPLAVLIAWQMPVFSGLKEEKAAERQQQAAAAKFCDFLRQQKIDAAYVWIGHYWLNFAAHEDIAFCYLAGDRLEANADRAEMTTNIAVVAGCGELREFLAYSGGCAQEQTVAGFPVDYDFRPPAGALEEISLDRLAAIEDSHSNSVLSAVTDGNADTRWISQGPAGTEDWMDITFRKPVKVAAVRFLADDEAVGVPGVQLFGSGGGRGSLEPITREYVTTSYYWSGPRVYWGGRDCCLEIRFPEQDISRLRIRFPASASPFNPGFSELQVLGPAPGRQPATYPVADLLRLLQERRIKRLYSGRWVANAVRARLRDQVQVQQEPLIYWFGSSPGMTNMTWAPNVALLTPLDRLAACRRCLGESGMTMRETPLGPWVLFDFAPGQWSDAYRQDLGLVWTAFGCLKGSGKHCAASLVERASRLAAAGKDRDAMALLKEALRACPSYQPAWAVSSALARKFGDPAEAARFDRELKDLTVPEQAVDVRFAHDVELLGVTLDRKQVRPGETFRIRYYWRCPPSVNVESMAAFVHFLRDGDRFQDDHGLLIDVRRADLAFQPEPEVFIESRQIAVPADAKAGVYQMNLGLFYGMEDRRLPVKTTLPSSHRRVELPVTVTVESL